ncbi:unnamed protein product [Urochloa humidicola]
MRSAIGDRSHPHGGLVGAGAVQLNGTGTAPTGWRSSILTSMGSKPLQGLTRLAWTDMLADRRDCSGFDAGQWAPRFGGWAGLLDAKAFRSEGFCSSLLSNKSWILYST